MEIDRIENDMVSLEIKFLGHRYTRKVSKTNGLTGKFQVVPVFSETLKYSIQGRES